MKNNEIVDGVSIDDNSLEIVSKAKKTTKVKKEETNGGAMRKAFKQRGY